MISQHSHMNQNDMHGTQLLRSGMHELVLASWTLGMQRHATRNPTPELQFKNNHEGMISGQGSSLDSMPRCRGVVLQSQRRIMSAAIGHKHDAQCLRNSTHPM